MRGERQVQLCWEARIVVVDDRCGPAETVAYPGITLARRELGHVVGETWLPVGEAEPTVADDEALIAVLHTAWRWSTSTA